MYCLYLLNTHSFPFFFFSLIRLDMEQTTTRWRWPLVSIILLCNLALVLPAGLPWPSTPTISSNPIPIKLPSSRLSVFEIETPATAPELVSDGDFRDSVLDCTFECVKDNACVMVEYTPRRNTHSEVTCRIWNTYNDTTEGYRAVYLKRIAPATTTVTKTNTDSGNINPNFAAPNFGK